MRKREYHRTKQAADGGLGIAQSKPHKIKLLKSQRFRKELAVHIRTRNSK